MNKHAVWFRRSVWLGILADWALGIPTIFAPEWVLSTLGFRPTGDPVWTAFAALLVVLLSLFYIPGANRPYRYKFNAWLAVFARPPGVIYFLILHPGTYPAFGILDGALFLIQLPLLLLVMKNRPAKEEEHVPAVTQAKRGTREHATRWLRRTIWLGILADWALGIPSIFFPEKVLELAGLRQTMDPVWTSFAAMILVLLSLFYIPGANRPYRYRANAWLAVFARPPGVIFFLLIWPGFYPSFALMDGSLFLLEIPFLLMVMQMLPTWRFRDREVFEYRGTTFRAVRDGTWSNPYPENSAAQEPGTDDLLPVPQRLGPQPPRPPGHPAGLRQADPRPRRRLRRGLGDRHRDPVHRLVRQRAEGPVRRPHLGGGAVRQPGGPPGAGHGGQGLSDDGPGRARLARELRAGEPPVGLLRQARPRHRDDQLPVHRDRSDLERDQPGDLPHVRHPAGLPAALPGLDPGGPAEGSRW